MQNRANPKYFSLKGGYVFYKLGGYYILSTVARNTNSSERNYDVINSLNNTYQKVILPDKFSRKDNYVTISVNGMLKLFNNKLAKETPADEIPKQPCILEFKIGDCEFKLENEIYIHEKTCKKDHPYNDLVRRKIIEFSATQDHSFNDYFKDTRQSTMITKNDLLKCMKLIPNLKITTIDSSITPVSETPIEKTYKDEVSIENGTSKVQPSRSDLTPDKLYESLEQSGFASPFVLSTGKGLSIFTEAPKQESDFDITPEKLNSVLNANLELEIDTNSNTNPTNMNHVQNDDVQYLRDSQWVEDVLATGVQGVYEANKLVTQTDDTQDNCGRKKQKRTQ